MSKVYTIYGHINRYTNEVYIGKTCQKVEYRWRKNGSGYKNHPKFYEQIQLFGRDAFDHYVVDKAYTEEEAKWREYYQANKDKIKQKVKQYQESHKEEKKEYLRQYHLRKSWFYLEKWKFSFNFVTKKEVLWNK